MNYNQIAAIVYTVGITVIAWWILAVVYMTIKRLTGIQTALERIADRMEKRCNLQCDKANEAEDETSCSG